MARIGSAREAPHLGASLAAAEGCSHRASLQHKGPPHCIHVIYETPHGGTEQSRAVAELMAPRLGWDQVETERQVADDAAQVVLTQGWRQR